MGTTTSIISAIGLGALLIVGIGCLIKLLGYKERNIKKIKRQLYYDYSYEDFRKMIVDVHMRAVANKDKGKEKKTLDSLVQLDEIYDFLSSELNLKDWRDIYNKYF